MAKRKRLPKTPDYTGTPKYPDKMIVQKTNPLLSLSQTRMTLAEFKILDVYLSRIDSHNPDDRYVQFEAGEFENLLGVDYIPRKVLEQRLDNLFCTLTIRDPAKPKGFTKIALFTKAECDQGSDGLWRINLACSTEAIEYMFNPENIGYLKYRLKSVINLTSRYSYILYLYLERNRWRRRWDIALDELKKLLNCKAETYNEFKRFNDLILKKCYKEINEKTNCSYDYETIRVGRRIQKIKFTVKTQNAELEAYNEQLPEQMVLDMEGVKSGNYESLKQEEKKQIIEFATQMFPNQNTADLDAALQYFCRKADCTNRVIKHVVSYFVRVFESDGKAYFDKLDNKSSFDLDAFESDILNVTFAENWTETPPLDLDDFDNEEVTEQRH